MNNPNPAINEIQNLISVNFERMVAFEQATFNAGTNQLKQYFEEKANESEKNMEELNDVLFSINESMFDVESDTSKTLLGTTPLFTGQKNINSLLKHVQYLEKSMISWYKQGIINLKGQSLNTIQVLNKQYTDLKTSQLYLQNC
ncbi:MAG TPA: hypothetical protein VLR49_13645 [Ferruginibacter sp.]|nr:hypothetical protein [Ferruginibacter sp.]